LLIEIKSDCFQIDLGVGCATATDPEMRSAVEVKDSRALYPQRLKLSSIDRRLKPILSKLSSLPLCPLRSLRLNNSDITQPPKD